MCYEIWYTEKHLYGYLLSAFNPKEFNTETENRFVEEIGNTIPEEIYWKFVSALPKKLQRKLFARRFNKTNSRKLVYMYIRESQSCLEEHAERNKEQGVCLRLILFRLHLTKLIINSVSTHTTN